MPTIATGMDMADFRADSKTVLDNDAKSRVAAKIGNAERPSNIWYRLNGQTAYWYMYALMDWYRSEVSVLSTIIQRSTSELFRYDLTLDPAFVLKCCDCGYETQTLVDECPVCHSKHLRHPDPTQKDYFRRPNGKSFIDEANDNGQSLKDVLRSYAESEWQNNQAYTLCITGDIYDDHTGELISTRPLEFISVDVKYVRYLYDETGKPGTDYAFTRDNRNMLLDLSQDPDAVNDVSAEGKVLYPAAWKVGNNYGATGKYWLYTQEEVYQDHWFRQSLIYGIPIWYDIEDDLLTYHYIEKHNLKKYKFGFVRKMIILPGFNDEDVEDITKGIQDVLATNDNSIPIVCTPPQLPGTAEMKAQTLELGTESSSDLMQIKNDIRDRLCAHGGVPNLFAGDVEASGGMNNESQQITIYDRYLMDKYNYIDAQCRWIMSWFPKITDWVLTINRPSKAYTDNKKRLDKIQEAQLMKQLGFKVYQSDGEFYYSNEPQDQVQQEQQEAQQQAAAAQTPDGGMMGGMAGGVLPGDGEGPPEKGTARREDSEIAGSKDEVEQSMRENMGAFKASATRP
jgi:hypothetical protein